MFYNEPYGGILLPQQPCYSVMHRWCVVLVVSCFRQWRLPDYTVSKKT